MDKLNDSQLIMDQPDDIATQIKIQEEIITNVLGRKEVLARTKRLKLHGEIKSKDTLIKAMALNKVISNQDHVELTPPHKVSRVIEANFELISEQIARNFVQNRIEEKVQEALMDRQDEYIDEMRMNIIRKEKGPENSKTQKKYQELVDLDQISLSRNINNQLRPQIYFEYLSRKLSGNTDKD